jgi:hypothetical protein
MKQVPKSKKGSLGKLPTKVRNKMGYMAMGGEDKSMNAMQQMKYGAEKMMTKATMTGKLDKAMGGMEMMMKKKMMKGGESKYPKRGMRAKTNKMNRKK